MSTPNPTPPTFAIQKDEPTMPLLTARKVVIPPMGTHSLGIDALLPAGESPTYSSRTAPFAQVVSSWAFRIESEQLFDLQIRNYRTPTSKAPEGLYLRDTDGALMRDPNGAPLAITQRAWTQLLSVLLQEVPDKPRSPVDAYRWLSPSVRSVVFDEVKARSCRKEGRGHELLLRSFIDPRFGVRALRAVVSGRHSGIHFDDLALIAALSKVIPSGAPAYCSRAIDATSGYAIVGQGEEARASIHWSNSETGAASLEFAGGCYITTLDAVVRDGHAVRTEGVLETESVRIASANDRTRRSHTLPRANQTEAGRAAIGQSRMATDIATATEAAKTLALAWGVALQTFARGWDRVGTTYSRTMAATVMLDLIEEHTRGGFKGEDRKAIEAVLVSNDRLQLLPFGSAAHIAGAWAVLAREQTSVTEAKRFQDEAGRWVLEGFGTAGVVVAVVRTEHEVYEQAMNH